MVEFKTKKLLTRPILKHSVGVTHYVKIESAMFVGREIKVRRGAAEGEQKKEPATLVNVINLEDGQPAQMIVNAVVKSVLNEEYPNEAYVGKCFSIAKQQRQPGKQYDPFRIEEIEDPAAESTQTAAAPRAIGGSHRK
jgi:hypothetical protein